MKKEIYAVPFTKKRLVEIEDIINETIDLYLNKNPDTKLSKSERAHLVGQAKDQLTVHIQELSNSSDRWTMSHQTIPVTVLANKEKQKKDLMSSLEPRKVEYFTPDKSGWTVSNSKSSGSLSKKLFERHILSQINESAATAAFYAIESHVACGRVYSND